MTNQELPNSLLHELCERDKGLDWLLYDFGMHGWKADADSLAVYDAERILREELAKEGENSLLSFFELVSVRLVNGEQDRGVAFVYTRITAGGDEALQRFGSNGFYALGAAVENAAIQAHLARFPIDPVIMVANIPQLSLSGGFDPRKAIALFRNPHIAHQVVIHPNSLVETILLAVKMFVGLKLSWVSPDHGGEFSKSVEILMKALNLPIEP